MLSVIFVSIYRQLYIFIYWMIDIYIYWKTVEIFIFKVGEQWNYVDNKAGEIRTENNSVGEICRILFTRRTQCFTSIITKKRTICLRRTLMRNPKKTSYCESFPPKGELFYSRDEPYIVINVCFNDVLSPLSSSYSKEDRTNRFPERKKRMECIIYF